MPSRPKGSARVLSPLTTPRLSIRTPTEEDRARFVELFCDEQFMVFAGALSSDDAHKRVSTLTLNPSPQRCGVTPECPLPGGRGRPRRACGICKPYKRWNRNARLRYTPSGTARREAACDA